ncbi:MAG: hypothetical protein A2W19_10910 [Spirochaetes bacterium RBG_16_49_21]|nr:MAG: hypothetical protein A2W19_10910 [Spirochaetes bacterium RBG_16_49_21]
MKIDFENIRRKAGVLFDEQVMARASRLFKKLKFELVDQPDKKERNRKIILALTLLFMLDYMMYCLHTRTGVFDIFPPIPSLDERRDIAVFLPALDGSTIFRERRSIPVYDSDEKTARELFSIVVKGSRHENTALAVPADLFVKKIWLYGKAPGRKAVCVFDLEPVELGRDIPVVLNSADRFIEALEKTIRNNIPSVKKIMVLENGVPGTKLWEP